MLWTCGLIITKVVLKLNNSLFISPSL
uniref:Uncharacterized protein n=1 Tax=Anguilla anguilla TaxID=7936 RepID=A0A0E9PQF5_ANGAN